MIAFHCVFNNPSFWLRLGIYMIVPGMTCVMYNQGPHCIVFDMVSQQQTMKMDTLLALKCTGPFSTSTPSPSQQPSRNSQLPRVSNAHGYYYRIMKYLVQASLRGFSGILIGPRIVLLLHQEVYHPRHSKVSWLALLMTIDCKDQESMQSANLAHVNQCDE